MSVSFYSIIGQITTFAVLTCLSSYAGVHIGWVLGNRFGGRRDGKDLPTTIMRRQNLDQAFVFMRENHDRFHLEKVTSDMLESESKVCYSKVNNIEVVNNFKPNYHIHAPNNASLELGETVLVFTGEFHPRIKFMGFSDDDINLEEPPKPTEYHIFKFAPDITDLITNAAGVGTCVYRYH